MASLSKLTFSGKMLTEPQNGGNMAFLDMSLDDIIILRKIEDTSTEEIKDGAENHIKNNSVSRRRSNTRKHRRQRGYSRFRNKVEERNDKPNQKPFGLKTGQSPLNRQPLMIQEKCNDNSKAQAEKNKGQSKGNQLQLKGPQEQSEEYQHYSERPRGQSQKSNGQAERSRGYKERSRGQSERSRGQSERSCGQSERSCGQSERSRSQPERSCSQSECSRGQSEHSRGQLERSRSHTERSHSQSERYHGHSERSRDHSKRSNVLSERSYGQTKRFHSQSERSRDQSGRHGRYSPVEIESEFDRTFAMKKSESFWKQMQQRNDPKNMNRSISPENDHISYENFQRRERYKKHGVKALRPTTKHATTESSQQQPKGIFLKFNFKAIGNQTKLSLNERFSKLKMEKRPEPVVSFEDQKAFSS